MNNSMPESHDVASSDIKLTVFTHYWAAKLNIHENVFTVNPIVKHISVPGLIITRNIIRL